MCLTCSYRAHACLTRARGKSAFSCSGMLVRGAGAGSIQDKRCCERARDAVRRVGLSSLFVYTIFCLSGFWSPSKCPRFFSFGNWYRFSNNLNARPEFESGIEHLHQSARSWCIFILKHIADETILIKLPLRKKETWRFCPQNKPGDGRSHQKWPKRRDFAMF